MKFNFKEKKKEIIIIGSIILCFICVFSFSVLNNSSKSNQKEKITEKATTKSSSKKKTTIKKSEDKVEKPNSDKNNSNSNNNSNNSNEKPNSDSDKPSKPNNDNNTSKPSGNNDTAHKHNYVEKFHTVHYDEKGHYENVMVTDKWIEYKPIYEAQVRSICNQCGADITGNTTAHFKANLSCSGYHSETIKQQVGTEEIVHDAVYEKQWVVDQPARDVQESLGWFCSSCGQAKK